MFHRPIKINLWLLALRFLGLGSHGAELHQAAYRILMQRVLAGRVVQLRQVSGAGQRHGRGGHLLWAGEGLVAELVVVAEAFGVMQSQKLAPAAQAGGRRGQRGVKRAGHAH